MASSARNHDYHLVDPSPWPFIGSMGAFVLAIGAVYAFHGHSYLWTLPGFAIVLYTMAAWWGDVIKEAEHDGHHTPVVQLHLRYGMVMFIASEVMFFVAWFWAYFGAALYPTEAIRLLSGVEALNGLVMVGWTASFTYLTMERFWNLGDDNTD